VAEPGSADFAGTEEMVVSATPAPRPAATIPNATTVLDGEALEASLSLSLDDALRYVPGLQVTRQGGRGGRSELYLRGLDPNHVVVLIDGVRLNDPTNSRGGSFDPTTLALLDIERVEIVRGPLSTVYGSDALAGAINVITKKARGGEAPASSVRVRGGRFDTASAVAQARAGLGDTTGLSLGASLKTFEDPNSDGGFDGASLKARLTSAIPAVGELDVFTRIHRSSARAFPDSSGGEELAVLRGMEDRNTREILVGATLVRPVFDFATIRYRVGHATRREETTSPGVQSPVLPPTAWIPASRLSDEYERTDVAATVDLDLWEKADGEGGIAHETRLVTGVEAIWEDGESEGAFLVPPIPATFHDRRRTFGVFGTLEQTIHRHLTLSGSLRFDTIQGENDRLSPSVGIVLGDADAPVVLYGNWGQGFKLPSFYALGNPIVGSTRLRKERSRGWEIGVRGRTSDGRLRGQVAYFDLRVDDLIDLDGTTFQLVNRARLVSRGIEFEATWDPNDWLSLRMGGTWNDTDFAGSADAPRSRPRLRGFAELVGRPLDEVTLTLRLLGVSSIKSTSLVTGFAQTTLNGYERLDLRAAWTPCEALELFVEVGNVTDATPREAIGFESPGIFPRAGLVLRH
ncbi:MAG: TonB-dependent receptor, partial [Myxococcota bacterium]